MLSLLAFTVVGIAVKLNLLVSFDQAGEAWTQRHITPLHTALMLTVTELASVGFVLPTSYTTRRLTLARAQIVDSCALAC